MNGADGPQANSVTGFIPVDIGFCTTLVQESGLR
jgi:hypothetical protein